MLRLDRMLVTLGKGSRSEMQKAIRGGRVRVNGDVQRDPSVQVGEDAEILLNGEKLDTRLTRHVMLHKPAGLLTAARDKKQPTVMDLLPAEYAAIGCMPVGRLDKDTEGLLLLTNDGDLMNNLLHPSREVSKEYLVKVSNRVTDEEIRRLRAGVRLDDDRMTSPADVHLVRYETFASVLLVTIHEGRNRQVRRMFSAIGHEVVALKRVGFATIKLHDLPRGQWRRLTDVEVRKLKEL